MGAASASVSSQGTHAPTLTGKDSIGGNSAQTANSPSSAHTYLWAMMPSVLVGVQPVLQNRGPQGVKGLHGTICGAETSREGLAREP